MNNWVTCCDQTHIWINFAFGWVCSWCLAGWSEVCCMIRLYIHVSLQMFSKLNVCYRDSLKGFFILKRFYPVNTSLTPSSGCSSDFLSLWLRRVRLVDGPAAWEAGTLPQQLRHQDLGAGEACCWASPRTAWSQKETRKERERERLSLPPTTAFVDMNVTAGCSTGRFRLGWVRPPGLKRREEALL